MRFPKIVDPLERVTAQTGARASMATVIAVGFGEASVTRDGVSVYTEPRQLICEMCDGLGAIAGEDDVMRQCVACGGSGGDYTGPFWSFADAEAAALRDPVHDWRVILFAPLHGETYQRHGDGDWQIIETNKGLA